MARGISEDLTRRGFFRLAIALGAVPSVAACRSPAPGAPLLSPREETTFRAAARTLAPPGGPYEAGADEAKVVPFAEELLRFMDPVVRVASRGVLWFLEYEPLFWRWKLTRFSKLSDADREAFLTGWAESRWSPRRGAFLLLKILTCLGFYSDPAVWQGIGYARLCKPEGIP